MNPLSLSLALSLSLSYSLTHSLSLTAVSVSSAANNMHSPREDRSTQETTGSSDCCPSNYGTRVTKSAGNSVLRLRRNSAGLAKQAMPVSFPRALP